MMRRLVTPRLTVAASLLVAFTAAASLGAGEARSEPAYSSWFRYQEDVALAWDFAEVDGDPNLVKITRKYEDTGLPQRKIFVLYPKPSSAYDVAISKILDVMEEKNVNAEFTVFNFGREDESGRRALESAAQGGYELIFSMGSASTAWLWDNYQDGEIPVVSVCSKDPVLLGQAADYESGSGTNFAFTSLNMPIEVQMAYVFELRPDLKNLGVLVDSQNISAVETQAKPIAEYARRRGVQVIDVNVSNPERAKEELQGLVGEAVSTMRKNDPTLDNSVFWVTGSTSVFREIRAINGNSDRVPVLSVVPEVVRAGEDSAVLSIGISFESNAHLAAIYGIDVLKGERQVGELPVGIVSPPDIAINFRKAREIGLEIPFSFFESASFVYDYEGRIVRQNGRPVESVN
ncbi:MAG: hypothetical protein MI920_01395 [Kiloniellales bacterium]|nr:hypothetical protein [Kiloniellales bacterium]